MEFSDYLVVKFIVMCVLAAVYGFWRGFTGQTQQQEPSKQDSTA